jgi:hypothetical protein
MMRKGKVLRKWIAVEGWNPRQGKISDGISEETKPLGLKREGKWVEGEGKGERN